MKCFTTCLLSLILFNSFNPANCRGGEFDRLDGERLAAIARGGDVEHRRTLTLKDLDLLPVALKDTRSTFLIVKTGRGNYARMLVSQALRQSENDNSPPVNVFVLERFDTFEPGKSGSRPARGTGVLLFNGSQIDLDSGQIVPKEQGGDLAFLLEGKGGARLDSLGTSEILTFKKPLTIEAPASGPSPGKTVIPSDFVGKYRLFADGRWSGTLEIEVAADRQITGRFRSESNGMSYPVTGQVEVDPPNKATFAVKFPRSEQEYNAFIWTEGKNAIAGTFVMTERVFGFVAIRDGTKLGAED